MLEPYVLKGTSTVLRGERDSNIPDLPDNIGKCVVCSLKYSSGVA